MPARPRGIFSPSLFFPLKKNKGFVTTSDLKHILGKIGEALTTSELQEIVTETDPEGTGQVSFEVVGRLMQRSEGSRASIRASGEEGCSAPCLPSLPRNEREASLLCEVECSSRSQAHACMRGSLLPACLPQFLKLTQTR